MKQIGILYFSETIRCWYSPEDKSLYVYSGKYVRYDHISELVWYGLKSDPTTDHLKTITDGFVPSVVSSVPKGKELEFIILYPKGGVEMYEVNSSNVKAAGYDRENRILYIQFLSKGHPVYSYENVPPSMWEALQQVDSKGSWVHWFLVINDGEFPYKRSPAATLIYTGETLFNPGTAHPSGYMVDSSWT